MRSGSLLLLAATAALTGCDSSWDYYNVPTGCSLELFFADGDGDLWGDPATDPQLECTPPVGFEATNDRDCDDGDALVTGRIGSICPDQLAFDPDNVGATTTYTGKIFGQSEFVVVQPPTVEVWPAAAEDACGPYGWGGVTPRPAQGVTDLTEGHLATISTQANLSEMLADADDVYAAWVGFRPANGSPAWDAGWGYYDSTGTWIAASEGISLPFCNCVPATADADTCADVYETTNIRYLAVVNKYGGNGARCLGTPDEALSGDMSDPDYATLYGHFICERPIPEPEDYNVFSEDEGLQTE